MAIKFLKATYKQEDLNMLSHYHDCHQILLIEEGEVKVNIGGAVYKASGGSLLFLSRLEEHSIQIERGPYKRYVIDVSPTIDEYAEADYKRFSVLFNRPQGFDNILDVSYGFSEIKDLFDRIVRERKNCDEVSEAILELYAREFSLRLSRIFPELFEVFENEKSEMVYNIQKDFDANFARDVSLDDLAKKYNISQSYLSHIFKSVTGKSVKNYLLACRIAAAKNYLAKSDKRINEIVELCGFSDHSNFSRIFKRTTGLSPVEFKYKYHNKEFVAGE